MRSNRQHSRRGLPAHSGIQDFLDLYRVGDRDPDIAINASVNGIIKAKRKGKFLISHPWRNRGIIGVVGSDSQQIFLAKAKDLGDIKRKGGVTTLMPANLLAINPDSRFQRNGFKLNKNPFAFGTSIAGRHHFQNQTGL
jgi:hypothetical protein